MLSIMNKIKTVSRITPVRYSTLTLGEIIELTSQRCGISTNHTCIFYVE